MKIVPSVLYVCHHYNRGQHTIHVVEKLYGVDVVLHEYMINLAIQFTSFLQNSNSRNTSEECIERMKKRVELRDAVANYYIIMRIQGKRHTNTNVILYPDGIII